ncbi:efflux RND transporter permease subunit [Arsukibacterium sp. UBA3155]|uniref:efflux RND transporter permease subunit n=1 Tax=Arsukibacterium sp. UBA3155 TaxID=1946058 RepID=UPI0025C46FD4|nr:efflux RND transporter permease subunit [Arsukibacterium sp. UBA3155]|tara:strand:- start:113913 stop:116996 length:3084 start_codon:yes stop_codon:yes gene_type:complete
MTEKPLAITRLALRRPVTITMLFISLLLFGGLASRLLPLEMFPGIDIPQLYVNVPYNNASPAEVERLITRPLEEALATVSGIKQMRSFSNENSGEVSLEFNWSENIGSKSLEVRERIDTVRHLLPDDVERVLVFQFNTDDMPIFQLRISSERDLAMAYDLLEQQIKRPLERVQGVSKVELYGVEKRQVIIRLDPDKLKALNVDANALLAQLRGSNFALTAGELRNAEQSVLVKPLGEYRELAEIEQLPVRPGLMLRDVASIAMELPKRQDGRHLNQTYAVGMNVFKESGANLVEVANAAMAVVKAADDNPAFNGIDLYVMDDVADGVTTSLKDLLMAGAIGALLSFVVLYLFLRHLTTTLVVVLSVPSAIVIALGAMYFMGYSLNILSMMGLMLAIGMLVDNAVVVTESIFRERAAGGDVRAATERGVRRVSLAVLAGTATTAIVFLPNIIGQKMQLTIFLEHVAIAICLCLAISLVMALSLIPLLTTKLTVLPVTDTKGSKLDRLYKRSLQLVMNWPKLSTLAALLVLASIAVPLGSIGSDDGDNGDNGRLFINYQIQGNYSLEEVQAEVTQMEAYLYSRQDEFHIESVYSYYTAGYAMSTVLLKEKPPLSLEQLKDKIRINWPPLVRARPIFGWGGGGGMQLHLLGNSTEVLMELSEMLVPMLQALPSLEDVTSALSDDQQEVQIILNHQQLERYSISAQQVAQNVSLALRGVNLRTFRSPEQGELLLRLIYDEKISHSLAELQQLPVTEADGVAITLAQLAELRTVPRLSTIRRFDRATGIAIQMNPAKDSDMDKARADIEQLMKSVALPEGYRWSFRGSFQRQDEEQQVMMVNMLLAVAMIYIVMAALFESLLLPTAVIGSLLFSLVGVFWTFLLTGTGMGVMGMIGMLVLMGIVVNNGIVLVDRINQDRELFPSQDLKITIIHACEARLKPILMTVSTTVLGLLPLAMGGTQIGGGGPSYAPMAIAIIGGLLFSTLTSLLLVPLTYYGLLKLRSACGRLVGRSKKLTDKVLLAAKPEHSPPG